MAEPLDINSNWEFLRGKAGRNWLSGRDPDGGACPVDLPHSWNASEEFRPGVDCYRGWGSYRKRFVTPAPEGEPGDVIWRLESEGFYGTGDLWLNGKRIAGVDGQYLGFSIDVGAHLRPGTDNTLALRLTNRCASDVLPGIDDPDFLLYGGLSGRILLRHVPALHLDPAFHRVACNALDPASAELALECAVRNASGRDRDFEVAWTVLDGDGRAIARTAMRGLRIPPRGGCESISCSLKLPSPRPWHPDSPYLYRVTCELRENGRAVDGKSTALGVRHAEFRPGQGFFLNGERVFLRGCNRHESMPGFGRALPLEAHRLDAALIRNAGLNFVRLSHYPQHPAFLDACDELGILVCAELASWKSVRGGHWLKAARRQWEAMIRRDRNHPSVILWCMGNESRHRRAYVELREMARRLDPGRPVTYAENHLYRARRKGTVGIPDVWGANYELDTLEQGAAASALNCVVVTECSNYPDTVPGDMTAELRQVATIKADLERIRDRPYVAGFALWCFNDYATMRKKRYRRFSGIVDAWRKPKMSYALLQAMFLKEPVVKVFADWGAGVPPCATGENAHSKPQSRRPVHVFTNCGKVLLRINGQPVAALSGGPHIVTALDYVPGELSAEVLPWRSMSLCAEDSARYNPT